MLNQSSNVECGNEARPVNFSLLDPARRLRVFPKILLATDFSVASRAAFNAALELCKQFGSKLFILHAFEYADAVTWPEGNRLVELPRLLQDAKLRMQELKSDAARAGVPCESDIRPGIAAQTIEDFIQAQHIDLAVIGTSALHGFERIVFGSTAETLMRNSATPVLIVGPRADPKTVSQYERPVVFATDFHPSTIQAIQLAGTVSRETGSTLHCLHVLPRSLESGSESHVIPNILSEALRHIASSAAGGAIEQVVCATTFGSEISNAVVDYAKQHKAKLIVLGVRQASFATSHSPAHIAFRIATEACCPVLTMAFPSHPESHLAASAACAMA